MNERLESLSESLYLYIGRCKMEFQYIGKYDTEGKDPMSRIAKKIIESSEEAIEVAEADLYNAFTDNGDGKIQIKGLCLVTKGKVKNLFWLMLER